MLYFKKTFEYLFKLEKGKRFLLLFLLALPCGVGAYFTAPTYVYHNWLSNYTVGNKNYLSALFFNGTADPYRVLIAGAVTVVFLLFSISIMASVVSRNLRVGVFSINRRLMREFNEAIFPAFYAVITAMALVIVSKLLLASLIVLFQTVSNVVLSAILSTLALFMDITLICYAISVAILYLPYMTFNGLRPFVSLASSANRLGGRVGARMFGAVYCPVILIYVIGALVGMAENFIVSLIVESLLYAFMLVYLLTLSFVSYYEINDLIREDYPREFFYTKIKRR